MKRITTSEQTSRVTEPPGKPSLADSSKKVRREHAGATAVIVAVTVILFAPVFQGRTFSMVAAHMYGQYPWTSIIPPDPKISGIVGNGYPQTDHAETFYPNSVFVTNAIRGAELPLWFPYSFGGVPLAETSLGSLLYPPRLLVIPFLDPINQHDFLLFTHLLLAGLGMYAFLRCLGINTFGAIFGAVAWEFSGYNALALTLEHTAVASAWFPLMMLGAVLTIRRQSFQWAVATGAAVGMAILTGLLNHVYVSIWVLACWYGLLTLIAARKLFLKGHRRAALLCLSLPVVSAIVAVALSAATWMGVIEVLSSVYRQPETLESQLRDLIPFYDFAHALIRPESASGPAGKAPDGAGLAFIGIPAVILAPLGLLRRSLPVFFVAIICVISVAFTSGFAPVVILLRSLIPYFGAIHLYTGFYVFCFAIAVLAAFGMTEVSKRLTTNRAMSYCVFGLACVVVAVEVWQLITFTWAVNPQQPKKPEWLFPETPLVKTLRDAQGEYRILPIKYNAASGAWTPPVFAGKVAAIFGLRSGSGYESLVPTPTVGLWSTVEHGGGFASDHPLVFRPYFKHDNLPIGLLEKISVGLLVTPPGTRPLDVSGRDPVSDGTLQLVYRGPDGWIYKDARALPRAFLVPRVLAVPDPPAALEMLIDQDFDARRAAIVIGEQAAAKAGLPTDNSASANIEATANIISDRLNDVEVEFVTPRAAMMVLNDSWDPRWKAFVDGVEHPVLRVNYAFRGVVVPEGRHRVLFLYRPPLLLTGLAVSAMSLVMVGLFYAGTAVRIVRRLLSKQTT